MAFNSHRNIRNTLDYGRNTNRMEYEHNKREVGGKEEMKMGGKYKNDKSN
jgi:hypothetical protein